MQRIGMVITLQADKVAEYKKLHLAVWPSVLATISACNITNYSIFLKEPENLLFSYFEYTGNNIEKDFAKMAEDEDTQRWWAVCKPCQKPLMGQEEQWWSTMEEVFYHA